MDTKLAEHQSLIECTIGEYAELYKRSDEPGVETLTVFDRERNHYILHTIGWAHLLTNRPPIRQLMGALHSGLSRSHLVKPHATHS